MNSKQISFAAFSDELAKVNTNKKIFLSKIERLIPWAKWESIIKSCYYKGERGLRHHRTAVLDEKCGEKA